MLRTDNMALVFSMLCAWAGSRFCFGRYIYAPSITDSMEANLGRCNAHKAIVKGFVPRPDIQFLPNAEPPADC